MDFHEFLRTRRSIRSFKPDPVPESVLERILTTATFAPSAHNLQPWRFIVVGSPEARTRLGIALTAKMQRDMQAEGASETEIQARAAGTLRRLDEAPVLIVLCRDVTNVRVDTAEEATMGMQSVAAAGLQLLLAAHAEGLGGNWICWPLYAKEETRAALDLPGTWDPQAMFFIGQINDSPQPSDKKLLEQVRIWR